MEEVDLKRGFNNVSVLCFTLWLPARSWEVWGTGRMWIFITPCCYFFWGFNRLSAFHTIFVSTFLLTLFLISTYWNSKDNIIHNDFIFLCKNVCGCWWFMSAVLAAQVVEIRRIVVPSQPGQIVQETLSWKSPSWKRIGGVAQGVVFKNKSKYHKKSVQSDKCNAYILYTHYKFMMKHVSGTYTLYICCTCYFI
jgi:hypothetical protein